MIRHCLLTLCSAIGLGACAAGAGAAPRPSVHSLAARLVREDAVSPSASARRKEAISAVGRIDRANRLAVHEPTGDDYLGAAQVYPWSEGALYRLYTAPEQVSDIALEPGEALLSVASGDTARWVIGDTASGTGAARRTHVLVKPSAAGLRTNLVIATDRRVYHVELRSTAATAMASVSWTYPDDALLALRSGGAAADEVAGGLSVEALNFDYRIEGDRPSWRPLRVFDDGRQVFIEFPQPLAEAPPLFVIGEGGRAQLVNYRVRGRYYVVDRLFAAAELRLGERHQKVVRIVRADARTNGRSGS
jgi:type IV secretion system protein TrbG